MARAQAKERALKANDLIIEALTLWLGIEGAYGEILKSERQGLKVLGRAYWILSDHRLFSSGITKPDICNQVESMLSEIDAHMNSHIPKLHVSEHWLVAYERMDD